MKDSTAVISKASSALNAQPNFEATVANSGPVPGSMPSGMVYIPGGEFSMGSLDPGRDRDGYGGDQLCELFRALPVRTDRFAAQLFTIGVSR